MQSSPWFCWSASSVQYTYMLLLTSCANTDQLSEACAKPFGWARGCQRKRIKHQTQKTNALWIFPLLLCPFREKKKAFRNRSYFAMRQETQWHSQICQISDSAVLHRIGPACRWQGSMYRHNLPCIPRSLMHMCTISGSNIWTCFSPPFAGGRLSSYRLLTS